MKIINQVFCATLLVFISSVVMAQQLIIYPAEGQTADQQKKDQAECQIWATDSTGIDPVAIAQSPPPQAQSGAGGERVRGATRGALGGAAIGAIAGDTGKGAAIGAVAGTMAGGRRSRQNKAADQYNAEAQVQGAMDTWNRAVGTCMSARGYSVG